MYRLVFFLLLSMWDKSCIINMHHFLLISSFLFTLLGWAILVLIRNTIAETVTALEGLGGFFLLLLLVWIAWNAILILCFLPDWS